MKLVKGWKEVNLSEDEHAQDEYVEGEHTQHDGGDDIGSSSDGLKLVQGPQKQKKESWRLFNNSAQSSKDDFAESETATVGPQNGDAQILNAQQVPTTFPEMFMFNAAVM